MSGTNTSGRKLNQQMKPYLVYEYLLSNSDANNTISAPQIVSYLKETGIDAERRSIYRDIDAINRCLWLIDHKSSIDQLEAAISCGDFEKAKTILYDKHSKGFFVNRKIPGFKAPAGNLKVIKLQINKSMVNSTEDYFGAKSINILSQDDKNMTITINTPVNEQLLGWISSLGTKVRILAPESLKTQFVQYLDKLKDRYW